MGIKIKSNLSAPLRASDPDDSGTLPVRPAVVAATIVAIVAATIAIRLPMLDQKSGDYVFFLKEWYEFILANGGFSALQHDFTNYNVPYLYLLAGLTYIPIPSLLGVKLIGIAFDLVMAYFVYRIVRLRLAGFRLPVLAAGIVLVLPTVATNSGLWGQADSIFAAFDVIGVYYVLRHRPWLACSFFGIALAFKLQAVFIFPLLLVLVLAKYIPWRSLLAIPVAYLVLDIPAVLLGADPLTLLSVYPEQMGQFDQILMRAASVYQFVPSSMDDDLVRMIGIGVSAVVIIGLIAMAVYRRSGLTSTQIILATTAFAILLPFLLPSMHERYFYLADVFTVIAAFFLPRRLWYVPALVQAGSFICYLDYFSQDGLNPPTDWESEASSGGGTGTEAQLESTIFSGLLPVASALMLVAAVVVVWVAFREFRGTTEAVATENDLAAG